jgi:hypothetical protein
MKARILRRETTIPRPPEDDTVVTEDGAPVGGKDGEPEINGKAKPMSDDKGESDCNDSDSDDDGDARSETVGRNVTKGSVPAASHSETELMKKCQGILTTQMGEIQDVFQQGNNKKYTLY